MRNLKHFTRQAQVEEEQDYLEYFNQLEEENRKELLEPITVPDYEEEVTGDYSEQAVSTTVPHKTDTSVSPAHPSSEPQGIAMHADDINYMFDQSDVEVVKTEAVQPLNHQSTQPPPGVSNMTGGSSGSAGSAPGTENPEQGGSTGTTPVNTSRDQGYGSQDVKVTDQEINDLFSDDEMLTEQDKLVNQSESWLREFEQLEDS